MVVNFESFSNITCFKSCDPQNYILRRIVRFRFLGLLLLLNFVLLETAGSRSNSGEPASESALTGVLDLGIFNYDAPSPAGSKLIIKIRPTVTVTNGVYSEGKFTIRCLASLGVVFTSQTGNLGFAQYGAPITNGIYKYYIFQT